jgi:DNA-binding NtrC family response regulator
MLRESIGSARTPCAPTPAARNGFLFFGVVDHGHVRRVLARGAAMRTTGTILIVDDEIELAENLSEILSEAGHDTAIAESAHSALARVDQGDVAAVITDHRLTDQSGAELIAELRRRGSSIPAVVMSAHTDDVTIDSASRAGALEFLPKPIDVHRLIAVASNLGRDEALVLIVEDDRDLADNLAEELRESGHDAAVSTSAAAALSSVVRPGAAIVDYRLPDATGIEVAERLLARDPQVRILFVSAAADELGRRLSERREGSDALAKPIDVQRLLAWVASATGRLVER